jgi:DNA (cytosine-5)-methyltransferase 1
MTTINQNPIADERPIDLLVGGTPCQSFSVAGLRKGLADPRGNLMLTFLSIADKFRPKWVVWENVPGVLSSNGGKDFGTFLGALGELGYGFAYRVLDAQHFGVAQRRRRVFVVGYLGDWRVAAAVLFERESLQGNTKPSRKKREEVTSDAEGSVGEAGQVVIDRAAFNQGENARFEPRIEIEETMSSLVARGPHAVAQPIAFEPGKMQRLGYGYSDNGTSPTLRSEPGDNQLAVAQPIAIDWRTAQVDQGITQTLKTDLAKMSGPCIAVDTYNQTISEHTSQTIGSSASDVNHYGAVLHSMAIRRLTPKECERLQGFPDDWTKIPYRNKPADQCPDGPRYKACGNSMAVPVMRWIGERINLIESML